MLIQRTTRQLKLTNAGSLYYEQCLHGLEEINRAEEGLSASHKEPQGLIRITAPVFLGSNILPVILEEMIKKYPKIKVEVLLHDQTMDLISEGIDFAIRAGDLKDSTLMAKKLGSVNFGLYASPSYLKKSGTPNHPKDLKDHFCIQFSPMGQSEWFFTNGKTRVNVSVAGDLLINELHVVKSLTLSGTGVALLPTYVCNEEENKGKLVHILPDWKSSSRNIHLVYPPQKFPSPKLKAFSEVAIESIKKQLM